LFYSYVLNLNILVKLATHDSPAFIIIFIIIVIIIIIISKPNGNDITKRCEQRRQPKNEESDGSHLTMDAARES
jgi:hypothetical protein